VAVELYSVGHSTRPIEEFLDLLSEAGIEQVVDVRRYPGSRRHPQFGRDALAESLRARDVGYRHEPRLGGRRTGSAGSPNTAWRNTAFRAYADHMASAEFAEGLAALLDGAAHVTTAVLCAEALPVRCHRRLIADAVSLGGGRVIHLLARGRRQTHELHPQARLEAGTVVYRAEATLELPKG
jgi:uncharacterized protein (DUF488 family)